MVIRNQP